MTDYVWVITHVNTKEIGEDCADEIGTAGPWDTTSEEIERAKKDGVTFRMLDDDGIWYYRGKIWFDGIERPQISKYSRPADNYYICTGMGGDEMQEFGPLNDFGTPNAGCTSIEYRIKLEDGTSVWAIL